MNSKVNRVLVSAGVTLALVAPVVGVKVFAFADNTKTPTIVNTAHLDVGSTVLVQAVELNNSIKEEIDRIREERRLEQEALDNFIASAKKHKFKNYDLRTPTGLKAKQLKPLLEGTNLEGLEKAYIEAEETYGVSAFVLIGISAHESSWGTSRLAKERNNLFGYQAYDSNVNAARTFKTKADSILVVAKHLSEKYLSEDGRYHKGYTLADVNHYYASDDNWAKGITALMNNNIEKLE